MWFDEHRRADRLDALLGELQALDADVIGLQEVVGVTFRQLQKCPWIRERYLVAEALGLVALSRLPLKGVEVVDLCSAMGRRLLLVDLEVPEPLRVGVVHLESMRAFASSREYQLGEAFAALRGAPQAALMGDFNFCSTSAENDNLDAAYLDLWAHLRPDEPGWTEDTTVNVMRRVHHRNEKHARYDRILWRGADWRPVSIELLGTEPIEPGLFCSDHFGLHARLVRDGTTR